MNTYDRYLAKRLLAVFFKIVLGLSLLVSIIDLVVTRQDNIIQYQIPPLVVLRYYVTFLPTILLEYQVAAVAILIAALMVLGRAAQDNEITALLAGGASLRRITQAPVLTALMLALAAFAAQETLGVRAAEIHDAVEKRYFSKVTDHTRFGVSWTNLSGGWTCHVLKFNSRALSGQDVYLHALFDDRVEEIRARRIYWLPEANAWMLEDGRWAVFDVRKQWEAVSRRITQTTAPFSECPEELFALAKPPQAKTAAQLAADIERAQKLGVPTQEHRVNYHIKFAQPALCFIIIWLAIPFAVRLRKGGLSLGFGVSVTVALIYLLLFAVSVGLGIMGKLPAVAAAWLANAVFMAAGLVMFRLTPS